MEWVDRFNAAIRYVEDNLTGEIDYARLGQIACCSAYHFQRMFAFMADVPLSEYIRRRRMSRAAVDLTGGERVLDVALKYGYGSPTAFTRAFEAMHGVSPSAVKNGSVTVKSFPPIAFQISVKGVAEMNYHVESRPAFRVVGKSCPLSQNIEENFQHVPALWQEAGQTGLLARLAAFADGDVPGVLGVSSFSEEDGTGRYFIAAATSQPADDLEELVIPAQTWAIFPGSGAGQSIQELERAIVTDWLPTSGYEYVNGPDVEVYLNADPVNMSYEVWIPVARK